VTKAWFDEWLGVKKQFGRPDDVLMDRETFFSLTVGTGLPAIEQKSTFSYQNADEGARRFSGVSIDGEAPYARIYTRLGNPTTEVFERLLVELDAKHIIDGARAAGLEGPTMAGQVFSSGLSAIACTIMSMTRAGDDIIVGDVIYGGTVGLLTHLQNRGYVNVTYVDTTDEAKFEAALEAHPNAKLVFVETPDNPMLKVTDIPAVSKLTEKLGIPLAVDNTFASPFLQQPLRLGADISIQSLTKYVNGHSASVGGCVVGPHGFVRNVLYPFSKDLGPCMSPFDSWLNRLTISTIGHRMEHQCASAQKIADFLEEHKRIKKVMYPGLASHPHRDRARAQMRAPGGMISFEMDGGIGPAKKLMNYFARHDTPMELAVSLGCVITYIQHPASMTHAGVPKEERLKAGLTDDLVRLSVGIEGVGILIDAMSKGLDLAY